MTTLHLTAAAVSFVLATSPVLVSDELTAIEPEQAKMIGKRLSDEAAIIDKPQVKIDADPEKAVGLHAPKKAGMLIVPVKGLQETEDVGATFQSEAGGPLAYLFLYHIVPVIDGKKVDPSRLRSVKLTDDQGTEHTVYVLLLAVRQLSEEDYRLYAYGFDAKPLIDSKFSEGTGPGPEPVAVELKDTDEQKHEGKLVVTVFGKYQAGFQAGYRPN
jgi:hypothetical protein